MRALSSGLNDDGIQTLTGQIWTHLEPKFAKTDRIERCGGQPAHDENGSICAGEVQLLDGKIFS